jgi:pilus assembly protein CpaB
MNRRLLLILICALIGGASASYLVYRLVGTRAGATPLPLAQVVIATRDLQIGTLIGASDVRMGPWAGTVPKDALASLDLALNRGAVANIYEGEPVLAERLATAGSGGGLAAIIPPGLRASAVKVNDVVGLAGFVTPGMRVDVLISGIEPGGNPGDGPHVNTLLQNIQVLSAGENLQKDSEGKPHPVQVVNLLVTPEQAEKLTLAGNQAQIQLVLRNPLDTATTSPPGAMMSQLFANSGARPPRAPGPALGGRSEGKSRAARGEPGTATSPPAIPAAPRPVDIVVPKVRVIEVFNGTTKTEVRFTVQEDPK